MITIDETQLRALVERPRRVVFWGQPYEITPRVIGKVFGDGQRLINISALAARPNYFVVRVDSAEEFDIRDILDELYEAAEDEFGRYEDLDEADQDASAFPVVDWGFGSSWGDRYSFDDLQGSR